MANKVSVEILLEIKEAQKGLKDLENQVKEMSDNAGKGINTLDIAVANFAANLATIAFEKLVSGAKDLFNFLVTDGVGAAQAQEEAINRMNIALKATGEYSEQASQDLQKFASDMQSVSKFGDEVILSNMALLKSITSLSGEGLKEATTAALDLASALNIDLRTATMLVGKAAEGNVAGLKRYGVEVKQGTTDAETFANTLTTLQGKFGGASQGAITTFAGSLAQLKNIVGDLQEEFGNMIIKNPAVIQAMQDMGTSIVNLKTWVIENQQAFDNLIGTLARVAVAFTDMATGAVKQTIQAFESLEVGWTGFTNIMGGSLGDWSQMKLGMDQVWVSLVGGTGVTGEYNKVLQEKAKITEQNIQADSKYAEVNKQIAEENAKALEAKNKILKAEQEQQDKKDAEAKARREKELADIAAHEQAILDTQTAFRTAEDERKVVQEELDLAKQEADKALEIEFLTARLAELELIKLDAQIKEQVLENNHYTALELRKKKHALEQKKTSEELAKEELAIKQKFVAADLAILQQGTALATSFMKQGSKEQFAVTQAAALATAVVKGLEAVAVASAVPPPPVGAALAMRAKILMGINIASIAAATIKGFAQGGIVGGNSYSGDRVPVRVNSGEMILNQQQQSNLFNRINEDNAGGGGISVNIQGNVMADDESQVIRLIDRINDAIQFSNAELRI